jgi:hypothetical protein
MKRCQLLIVCVVLCMACNQSFAQEKVKVIVHPGTELMNAVWLLSDPDYAVKSTYRVDALKYFSKWKDDSAVLKAKKLPYINCDFPVRLSWVFYDFPNLKLSLPDTLFGYESEFNKKQVQDYLSACLRFYKRSDFKAFFYKEQPEYKRWIASFNRILRKQNLLPEIDSFYRFPLPRKVIITLGALNCATYAVPEVDLINPRFQNTTVIHVGYGNLIGRYASDSTQPNFYDSLWESQLVFHEVSHAYLADLFKQYKAQIDSLEYIREKDTNIQKRCDVAHWTKFLNENVTQGITSLLRIRTGKIDSASEIQRLAEDSYYIISYRMMEIIGRGYPESNRYANFKEYFPDFLKQLRREYPN